MNYLKLFATFLLGMCMCMCMCMCIAQSSDHFICHIPVSAADLTETLTMDCESPNGRLSTPDGTLNSLIVFAGFEGFEGNADPNQPQPPLRG